MEGDDAFCDATSIGSEGTFCNLSLFEVDGSISVGTFGYHPTSAGLEDSDDLSLGAGWSVR